MANYDENVAHSDTCFLKRGKSASIGRYATTKIDTVSAADSFLEMIKTMEQKAEADIKLAKKRNVDAMARMLLEKEDRMNLLQNRRMAKVSNVFLMKVNFLIYSILRK